MARSRKSRRIAIVLVLSFLLFGGSVGLSVLGLGVATVIPLQPSTVVGLYPPVEDRSGRNLSPGTCGLNQVREADGCRDVNTTAIEEQVTFPSRLKDKGIAELRGTLTLPQGMDRPRPGLVIVHGSGPNLRDGFTPGDMVARYDSRFELYKHLADVFSRQGIVVLRYDKRTSGPYSKEINVETFAYTDLIDDAKDALDFLAAHPAVDGQALILLGHSQGGMHAPHIVHGDERVAAAILYGGSTETFGEVIINQIERAGELRKRQWDYITGPLAIPVQLEPYRQCYDPIWAGTFDPDEKCRGVSFKAIADYETLLRTTGAVMGDLHCPLMAIQGSGDVNIDPVEIPRMQTFMKGRDAEFHYIYGLDHNLVSLFDRPEPIVVDSEALARFQQFLASVPFPNPVPEE